MTARTRIWLVVGAVAAVAAAVAVLVAAHAHSPEQRALPAGAPRLFLDLGVRDDAETRTLRRAATLYDAGKRAQAEPLFARYGSPQARVGAAFADWPAGTLGRLEGLAQVYPRNAFVLLHLGLARLWSGDTSGALAAWKRAERAQPDEVSALRAQDFLHPEWDVRLERGGFALERNLPILSFTVPPELAALPPARRVAALRARAVRGGVRWRVLYGLELARQGHRISAERVLADAARRAPENADAATAAAFLLFDKEHPERPFSKLGPLVRRFPHSASVRFNLGLLLVWLRPPQIAQAKREFAAAVRIDPRSRLAAQARVLLRAAG